MRGADAGDGRIRPGQRPADAAHRDRGRAPVGAFVTRTLWSTPDDPAFAPPTKPIGRYLPADEAKVLIDHGQSWEDRGERGWRRVVPARSRSRSSMLRRARRCWKPGSSSSLTAAAEGAGRAARAARCGVSRRSSTRISPPWSSGALDVDVLVIATDVDRGALGFGTPAQRPLGRLRVAELRSYCRAGHFASGSMGPKVEAACRFVEPAGVVGDHLARPDRTGRWPPRRYASSTLWSREGGGAVPDAIEVRKVPISNVSDASGLAELLDAGVMEADRVVAVSARPRGTAASTTTRGSSRTGPSARSWWRRGSRVADRSRRSRSCGPAVPTASSARTRRSSRPSGRPAEQTDEPRLTVGLAMSEVHPARGDRYRSR